MAELCVNWEEEEGLWEEGETLWEECDAANDNATTGGGWYAPKKGRKRKPAELESPYAWVGKAVRGEILPEGAYDHNSIEEDDSIAWMLLH